MHRYMRAIGFGDAMKQKELKALCKDIEHTYEGKCAWKRTDDSVFAELEKDVGLHMGVCLRGEYGEDGVFHQEYYFPYFKGRNLAVYDSVSVERHAEKDSFAGVCENICMGMNMIFYLQNAVEYMKYIRQNDGSEDTVLAITLSALSVEGSILLPVQKSRRKRQVPQPAWVEHSQMLDRAKQGDEEAIENLALEDMDLYSTLSRRVKHEDVYSIVDTYFMPYGIECDQYAVLGEIEEMEKVKNTLTGETIYLLNLRCNEVCFDVCINEKDLVGVPEEGRRFKGVVWMQGYVTRA